MNCKDLRVRCKNYKKYLYCKINRSEVTYEDCKECENKNYKSLDVHKKPIKNSYINKLERNRFSIITDDLDHCIECSSMFSIELHEVFFGKNRQSSMKYGCVIPLCRDCHKKIHLNNYLNQHYKRLVQAEFESLYSREEFVDIFKKNYLD